ncbi:hypothetical protein Patl1_33130 [Pistacia atlantica]|uniref:Uncharacterized protein n=1 Tax=Pistacia atlantica TaxID=434234 RepID=A0ACC1AN92_9ROSI|nr:hypothetical protein Patl1_33130 [Pistacia atlantica]
MLLTTRYRNVCTYREYQSLIHLDVLKDHEGVALLKKEAGIDDDCVNLNPLATRIAGECGGLPLALDIHVNKLKVSDECFEEMKALEVLKRIPSNLIRSFSQLEELYVEDIFEEWEVEEKSIETGNARLSEVNDLSSLAVLYLKINSKCLPKDFAFSELSSLQRVTGCQNILPSIDQKGLKKLNTLQVAFCEDLKCMIDASQVGEENAELHPRCKSLAFLFTLSIARSLGQLKSLRVEGCKSLEFLIKIAEGDDGKGEKMLSKLEDLRIERCSRLEYVFPVLVAAGLIQLKNLEIEDAAKLKQVFHGKEENEVAEEGKDIKLPNLKNLKLYGLEKLTRFFPKNNHSTLPALEGVNNCNHQFVDKVLTGLRRGFFKNLEDLHIGYCGAKVVFQVGRYNH